MNESSQFKRTIPLLLVVFVLASLALSHKSQAVSPPPDGGYPGQNTAEGQSALLHLGNGTYNTAVGWASLGFNVTGTLNTAIGAAALLTNTADNNTAIGAGALLSNTTGSLNTANGASTLLHNTTGGDNTANGALALLDNTTGGDNTAVGVSALELNSTASGNTALGSEALAFNAGDNNTAAGFKALLSNTTGSGNCAFGWNTLVTNTTGHSNTAIGYDALFGNTTGLLNTAVGESALGNNTTGTGNTALGFGAGDDIFTADNVICIGHPGADVSNSCFIGFIRGVITSHADAIPVLIDSSGQLGTASSSRRYKTDIKPIDEASEAILALKPVSFRYKVHKDRTSQFGLIAEDVAEVNPNLVIYDADGKPYTVRYDAVNAMLLNEFLKEHRKVEEQEATISQLQSTVLKQEANAASQQKQIEALTAGLQKVSVQLEVSKTTPQTVVNNQ